MDSNKILNVLKRAIKLHEKKDYASAEKLYHRVIKIDKNNYDAIRHLGISKMDQNKLDEARPYFEKSIQINNKLPQAFNNLGSYFFFIKEYDEAIKQFFSCLERNSTYWPAINNLGRLFVEVQDAKKAIKFSEFAFKAQPHNMQSKKMYAQALILDDQQMDGIKILKEIIEDEDDIEAYHMLQTVYRDLGHFELSNFYCDETLKINPYEGVSIYNLSQIKNYQCQYFDINRVKENIDNQDQNDNPNNFSATCFGLYRIYENEKKYDLSFQYLHSANNAQYNQLKKDINEEYVFLEKLREIFKEGFIEENQSFGSLSTKPIFILGMPRSGTTLTEQILSSHSEVFGCGELPLIPRLTGIGSYNENNYNVNKLDKIKEWLNEESIKRWGEKYLSSIEEKNNKTNFFTDKLPHNFIQLGFIKMMLPNAKVIYCTRDPMDNCFSLYRIFFNASHNYFYDQETCGLYYKFHKDLMRFWTNDCGIEVYNLKHEELISNPEPEMKKLLDYCNLKWEDQCMSFHENSRKVRTASNLQVRRPINKDSVMAWKKYENQLQTLKSSLSYND